MLAGALLLAAALLVFPGWAMAQEAPPARAPEASQPARTGTAPGESEAEPKAGPLLPIPGLEMGIGLTEVDLRAPALGVRLKGGTPSQTGAVLQVDWVGRYLRLGYARQFYRNSLPAQTTLNGAAAKAISFDADQFWSFIGLRPFSRLYLGLGLGWQRRLIRVLRGSHVLRDSAESRFLDGFQVDWAFGPPFSVQLRVFRDLRPGFVNVRTAALMLDFTAAF